MTSTATRPSSKILKKAAALTVLLGATVLMGICCVKQGERHKGPAAAEAPVSLASAEGQVAASPSTSPPELPPTADGLLEGYAIGQPDDQQELPQILTEISGLTDISNTEIACVQDEEGTVFIYDLVKREITRQFPFANGGDFEGLTRVGRNLYVLRSDGTIFEIEDYTSSAPKSRATNLRMPTPDNEGLCYDPVDATILIAPKSRLGKGEEEKRTRALFRYDPEAGKMDPEPVVVLDLDLVTDGRERQRETKRGKKRVMPSRFLPSSVSVHPKTGNYFVVSAVAHNLVVFDRQGKLKAQYSLDPKVLPQPEGLTFLPDETLVLTSEGTVGRRATLLRFRRR